MVEGPTLTRGLSADLDGEPCPPQLIRWLATLDNDLLSLLEAIAEEGEGAWLCLLYTSPSPRDRTRSRMPSSA